MQTYKIDGLTVYSSFDQETAETLLRSAVAIARAKAIEGFEALPEWEQQQKLVELYTMPLPKATDSDPKVPFFDSPKAFTIETGERVVVDDVDGRWYVLTEQDMLSFRPI